MKRGRLQEGLLLFWCFKRSQEYDLVETGKVLNPAHLDALVNVVYQSMMLSHKNGLVSILLCLMYAIESMKVRRYSEISHLLKRKN